MGSHRDFEDGGSRLLIGLNELNNWNKHNLITLNSAVTEVRNFRAGGLTVDRIQVFGGVATPIAIGRATEAVEASFDKPNIDLVFADHVEISSQRVLPVIIAMHNLCTDTLAAFCNAFPSPTNPTFGPKVGWGLSV